jgi:tRNA pseudouridine55 synthase
VIVTAAPSAVWPVDKPAGPTSHDVVARVRRGLPRGVKVGHAGTLDPFATGLLLVLVGRATRLTPYLSGLDKAYLADVALGTVSATGDPEGPLTRTGEAPPRERIEAALPGFLGPQRQRVPAFAAVKVGGERLYRRARRGEAVEAPERDVVIHRLELVDHDAERGVARLLVECSKGTYLRQLAIDLGERLGCGAHCAALRRLRVGPVDLEDAVAPEEVGPEGGLDPLRALAHLPRRELAPDEVRLVAHGRPVPAGEVLVPGPVALAAAGRLVAVAEGRGGALRPSVVLVTPGEAA